MFAQYIIRRIFRMIVKFKIIDLIRLSKLTHAHVKEGFAAEYKFAKGMRGKVSIKQ